MIMFIISKLVKLIFGFLLPAYASFLVVKNKDVKGYVRWMMYWIVLAFYNVCESMTDLIIAPWFPFYYEIKIAFVLWMMLPATSGAGTIYRQFIHPKLIEYETDIEEFLTKVKHDTYCFVFDWMSRFINNLTRVVAEAFWIAMLRRRGRHVRI